MSAHGFQLDLLGEREDPAAITARLEREGRGFLADAGPGAVDAVHDQLARADAPLSPLVIGLGLGWYGLSGCYAVLAACERLAMEGRAVCVPTQYGPRWATTNGDATT